MFREANRNDLGAILEIMNHNIRNTTAVYLYEDRTKEDLEDWFREKQYKGFPVYVVEQDEKILGYGTYGTYRAYAGYRKTVEHSVYVVGEHQGQGIGSLLLSALVEKATMDGYHVMLAYIDADNQPSIRLHEKTGFETCGRLREVGYKFQRYLDVVIMEKILSK